MSSQAQVKFVKFFLFCFVSLICLDAYGQGNGKLQLHFMDVNQGDGAIRISPEGQTVLFDNGVQNECDKPLNYLRSLRITKIDYLIVSHYHADHFGCTKEVLEEFPLQINSYDRPGAYNSSGFTTYVKTVGKKRKNVYKATNIVLDEGSANPVKIAIAGYNGAGVKSKDENDLSVAAVIHFMNFDVMMAGDLSGYKTNRYKDIESVVARKVGQMEVYKVNHHGSEYSSNPKWMKKLSPRIAIVSAGDPNDYGHPTEKAMKRIHASGVAKTYWTSKGDGAAPVDGKDIIANGSIIIEVSPGENTFSVKYDGKTDVFEMWSTPYKGRR